MPSKESASENTKAQLRKGILEFCTLLIIARGRVYAPEIVSKLKRANLIVVEGTLYPLLSRLRATGLLSHSWEESKSGPPRKYYELTESGHDTLEELTRTWKNLATSISSLIRLTT